MEGNPSELPEEWSVLSEGIENVTRKKQDRLKTLPVDVQRIFAEYERDNGCSWDSPLTDLKYGNRRRTVQASGKKNIY